MKPFDIIAHPLEGTTLIEASAGTGKTYTIAGLYLRLILEKDMEPGKILVVTFTRAATEELRDRIRKRLRDALHACREGKVLNTGDRLLDSIVLRHAGDREAVGKLTGALRDFDEAAIFTIHSFCQRVLRENAFESSSLFNTELAKDQTEMSGKIADDFWRIHFYSMPLLLVKYYREKYGLSGDDFASLLKKYSPDPNFTVVPDEKPVEIKEILNQFTALEHSFSELRTRWNAGKGRIADLLLQYDGLMRNKYRSDWVQGWIASLDSFFEQGEPLYLFDRFDKFTREGIDAGIKKGHETPDEQFFDECTSFMALNETLCGMIDRHLLWLKKYFFTYYREELARRKSEESIRSFDDIIADMHQALRSRGGKEMARAVGARFSAALIDEFQDTDPLQYDIFTGIFRDANHILFLIGDPKQAIYGFRSADIFAYLKAKHNVDAQATLIENWRSTSDLIGGINAVFSTGNNPFVFDDIEFTPAVAAKDTLQGLTVEGEENGAPLKIWFLESSHGDDRGKISKPVAESLSAKSTADEISKLTDRGSRGEACIDGKPLLPKDIAVLVRKNRQARMIQQELAALGIPAVLYGSESIFSSREAEEIVHVMAAVLEPGNGNRVRVACATDLLGMKAEEIHDVTGDDMKWEELSGRFYRYHDIWRREGFSRMFRTVLREESIRERILRLYDGERRMTNYLHCAEVIHRREAENGPGMEGLFTWFVDRCQEGDASDEHQLRLETDENAVTIVTIHSSKGLEYPVVFCPFLFDGVKVDGDYFTFHQPPHNGVVLDIGSGNNDNKMHARMEELAESVRLMYVALTRAKYRCYLTWGMINKAETSAPFYLFHGRDLRSEPENILQSLSERSKELDSDTCRGEVMEISRASGNSINVEVIAVTEGIPFARVHEKGESLSCCEFNGTIVRNRSMVSYSSLVKGAKDVSAAADHDSYDVSTIAVVDRPAASDIFSFPRGAGAGNCIHWIFENSDFTRHDAGKNRAVIEQGLVRFGFPVSWTGVIDEMMSRVLNAPLGEKGDAPYLRDAGKGDRINEMDFMVPLDALTPEAVCEAAVVDADSHDAGSLRDVFSSLSFSEVRGYLRGFIDLVFRHDGRYYIVDWKSNHLGNSPDAYSPERMAVEMKHHNYYLQYYLYTAALHRYLTLRLPGYRYEAHFGGVRYVFIRGVGPGGGTGIFRDLPPVNRILKLSAALGDIAGGCRT